MDKVYCKTINCPYRFTCDRYIENHIFLDKNKVEIIEYEHTLEKCNYYERMD